MTLMRPAHAIILNVYACTVHVYIHMHCMTFTSKWNSVLVYVCAPYTGVCSGNASEESVETLSGQMEMPEFVIKPGIYMYMHTHSRVHH